MRGFLSKILSINYQYKQENCPSHDLSQELGPEKSGAGGEGEGREFNSLLKKPEMSP
jgi:hypothetical protein